MIGSWIYLRIFLRCWIQLERGEGEKINCGGFPPKGGSSRLRSLLGCNVARSFPWKSVWWTQAHPRAIFFAWSAGLGKILTLDNLRRRWVIVTNRFCMCKRSEETVDHLLLHCEIAYDLWSAFFGGFGLSWVMPRQVFDLLACWWSTRRGSVAVWKMVPICFFWCLWSEK